MIHEKMSQHTKYFYELCFGNKLQFVAAFRLIDKCASGFRTTAANKTHTHKHTFVARFLSMNFNFGECRHAITFPPMCMYALVDHP